MQSVESDVRNAELWSVVWSVECRVRVRSMKCGA